MPDPLCPPRKISVAKGGNNLKMAQRYLSLWKRLWKQAAVPLKLVEFVRPSAAKSYERAKFAEVMRDTEQGLALILQCGSNALPMFLRTWLRDQVRECYPVMRRSALRQLIEGDFHGGMAPARSVKPDYAGIQMVMHACDMLETIAQRWAEQEAERAVREDSERPAASAGPASGGEPASEECEDVDAEGASDSDAGVRGCSGLDGQSAVGDEQAGEPGLQAEQAVDTSAGGETGNEAEIKAHDAQPPVDAGVGNSSAVVGKRPGRPKSPVGPPRQIGECPRCLEEYETYALAPMETCPNCGADLPKPADSNPAHAEG